MEKTTLSNKNLRPTMFLAAILVVAVFVRVVFLVQLQRSELDDFLSLDSRLFYAIAHTLSAGGTLPPGALTFNPFYPAFLVVMFKIFGDGLLAPRIVQFILGILTIVLAYVAGSRLALTQKCGKSLGRGVSKARHRAADVDLPGGAR